MGHEPVLEPVPAPVEELQDHEQPHPSTMDPWPEDSGPKK